MSSDHRDGRMPLPPSVISEDLIALSNIVFIVLSKSLGNSPNNEYTKL